MTRRSSSLLAGESPFAFHFVQSRQWPPGPLLGWPFLPRERLTPASTNALALGKAIASPLRKTQDFAFQQRASREPRAARGFAGEEQRVASVSDGLVSSFSPSKTFLKTQTAQNASKKGGQWRFSYGRPHASEAPQVGRRACAGNPLEAERTKAVPGRPLAPRRLFEAQ